MGESLKRLGKARADYISAVAGCRAVLHISGLVVGRGGCSSGGGGGGGRGGFCCVCSPLLHSSLLRTA